MKTKLAALAGVIVGVTLLLIGGGGAPPWLRNAQAALFCSLALLYGFSAFAPSAPSWLSSRPVMGIASVYMGVAVMLVPANIVTSAFFLGLGIRLLMAEKPRVRVVEPPRGEEPGTALRRGAGDIVLHQNGQIVTRD